MLQTPKWHLGELLRVARAPIHNLLWEPSVYYKVNLKVVPKRPLSSLSHPVYDHQYSTFTWVLSTMRPPSVA